MGSNAWLRAGPGAAGLVSPGVGIPEVLSHYEVVVSFKDVFLDSAVSCHTACTTEATPSAGALGSYYRAACVTQFSYFASVIHCLWHKGTLHTSGYALFIGCHVHLVLFKSF